MMYLCKVALLAEGVDRNPYGTVLYIEGVGSPSSRRAWIEIHSGSRHERCRWVALLAEGVDRNIQRAVIAGKIYQSPSSRRAWIEIGNIHRVSR